MHVLNILRSWPFCEYPPFYICRLPQYVLPVHWCLRLHCSASRTIERSRSEDFSSNSVFSLRDQLAHVQWHGALSKQIYCIVLHFISEQMLFVANALISFLAYMLLHFLENTFCQPKLGSRLVERNDYSEMLLNSSRASEEAFLCNLCGWQRAVCCRWQDDRPSAAQA